jgi:hypothetical protein
MQQRQQAVAELRQLRADGRHRTLSVVAANHGISTSTLRRWDEEHPSQPAVPTSVAITAQAGDRGRTLVPPAPVPPAPAAPVGARTWLAGIAHHHTCGLPLIPVTTPDGQAVYTCRSCPRRPAIPADLAERSVRAAITLRVPRLGSPFRPHIAARLLSAVWLDDRGRCTRLTWYPAGPTPPACTTTAP